MVNAKILTSGTVAPSMTCPFPSKTRYAGITLSETVSKKCMFVVIGAGELGRVPWSTVGCTTAGKYAAEEVLIPLK